ncbi:hypothetical protein chiPu_0026649, partial [Chiloscyllium punctatum]|nr:hypothetical protein [Chiloscyllium punctatum]
LRLHTLACFIFSLAKYTPLTYNKVYKFPDWAEGLGWMLALSSMICIPLVVVVKIIQSDGPIIEVRRWWRLDVQAPDWVTGVSTWSLGLSGLCLTAKDHSAHCSVVVFILSPRCV